MITKEAWSFDATVLQYEKLSPWIEPDTGTFSLADGITGKWGKDYHVYLLAVNEGGDNKSDHASAKPTEPTTPPEHGPGFEEFPKIPLGQTGWIKNSDGTWSYGDADKNAVIGPMIDNGHLYVFSEKGKMITGWEKVGNHWYCAQATGEAYHDLWKEISGN